jgi:ferredoxin
MQAMRNGSPMLISSGYISHVDESLCIGCEDCVKVCPFAAIRFDGEHILIDGQTCMGCGVCVSACAQGALSLDRDPQKPMPLEINESIHQPVI